MKLTLKNGTVIDVTEVEESYSIRKFYNGAAAAYDTAVDLVKGS